MLHNCMPLLRLYSSRPQRFAPILSCHLLVTTCSVYVSISPLRRNANILSHLRSGLGAGKTVLNAVRMGHGAGFKQWGRIIQREDLQRRAKQRLSARQVSRADAGQASRLKGCMGCCRSCAGGAAAHTRNGQGRGGGARWAGPAGASVAVGWCLGAAPRTHRLPRLHHRLPAQHRSVAGLQRGAAVQQQDGAQQVAALHRQGRSRGGCA